MTEQTYDYGDDTETPASSDKLAQLNKLAVGQNEARIAVAAAEADLAAKQKTLRDYEENLIPSIMSDLKLKDFTTLDGMKIVIEDKIRASITDELKPRAFIWLRENGHAALIKHKLEVDFSMGEDALATEWFQKMEGAGLNPEEKESVHPSTLVSFVREMLTEGKDIPDSINVFRQDVAKVTLPKKVAPRAKR